MSESGVKLIQDHINSLYEMNNLNITNFTVYKCNIFLLNWRLMTSKKVFLLFNELFTII